METGGGNGFETGGGTGFETGGTGLETERWTVGFACMDKCFKHEDNGGNSSESKINPWVLDWHFCKSQTRTKINTRV